MDSLRVAAEPLMELRYGPPSRVSTSFVDSLRESFASVAAVRLLQEAAEAEQDSLQRRRIRLLMGYLALTHVEQHVSSRAGSSLRTLSGIADSAAIALGFPGPRPLLALAHDVEPEAVTILARQVMEGSDSLAEHLARRGKIPGYVPAITSSPPRPEPGRFDRLFLRHDPAQLLVLTFARTGLHLALSGSQDTVLTLECAGEQRMTHRPVPGSGGGTLADAERLFFEAGLCLQVAHTREIAVEFRFLGDPAVPRAFGLLFEGLPANQAWIRQHLGVPASQVKELVEYLSLKELMHTRADCRSWREAPGLPREGSLDGPGIRLRARLLEALIDSTLTARYGVNWFENPAAYEVLQSLWGPGTRRNSFTVAASLGAAGLTAGPWRTRLLARLRFASR